MPTWLRGCRVVAFKEFSFELAYFPDLTSVCSAGEGFERMLDTDSYNYHRGH